VKLHDQCETRVVRRKGSTRPQVRRQCVTHLRLLPWEDVGGVRASEPLATVTPVSDKCWCGVAHKPGSKIGEEHARRDGGASMFKSRK
jgi:hypothetical protein